IPSRFTAHRFTLCLLPFHRFTASPLHCVTASRLHRIPMLIPVPSPFRRRRELPRRPGAAPVPPPVTPDQILLVTYGPAIEQIVVTASSEVVSVQDLGLGFWVTINESDWLSPIGVEYPMLTIMR